VEKTPDINKILANMVASSKYGASMGRTDQPPDEETEDLVLYVQRIKFVDGDYDAGGAYWGGGSRLYCAFNRDCTVMVFLRENSLKEAVAEALKRCPGMTKA
jgi:hypothetical protein